MLQDRDLELLKLFRAFRLATTSQLFALVGDHFGRLFLLQRRLQTLSSPRRVRYLVRPPEQEWRLFTKRGNPERVYALGNRGVQVLRAQGFELSRMDYDQKAKAIKAHSFAHPLLTTHAVAAVLRGLREHPELELERLAPDGDFYRQVTFFDGSHERTLPVKPDTLMLIHEPARHERTALFLEADRGTMPRARARLASTSFLKKGLAYFHYWMDKPRVLEDLGTDNFIVLTVTETPQRAEALRETAREIDPEKRGTGTDLFWFTSRDRLLLEDGHSALSDPIWKTAADDEVGSVF